MQLIRRHKKANGLLEPTAWGCLSLPRRRSTSITSISNPPASCRHSVCASCHRNGPWADATSDLAEADILTDQLDLALLPLSPHGAPRSLAILMGQSSRWDKSTDGRGAWGVELRCYVFALSCLSSHLEGQTIRWDTDEETFRSALLP